MGSYSKGKSLLGSLKILNLSFCEQLRSLGGFDHFPKLEMLILKGCIGLLEVCESIEQCVKLVLVDLSSCSKLQKLRRIIGKLKKVETLLLNGCYLGESRIEIRDMDSAEMVKGNNISINTITSFSAIPEAVPSSSKFFGISLPISLVSLSLVNNNLSTESFPVDFSCLTMLKHLYLDGNPIVSMPSCVRSLHRLETLSMDNCNMLTSVEHAPHTLKYLSLYSSKPSLQKVVFDPQMFPLEFFINWNTFAPSSFEFEGLIKIQPMVGVEEKVLRSLGWSKIDFLKEKLRGTPFFSRPRKESEIQVCSG